MADYTGIFERVEQKYLLDSLQFEALWAVLEPYMRPDEYGRSTICNIYFDTPNYLLARLSGEKPVYKEKLLLSVENPYVGNVVLREGLPRTDRKEHGYGTRSISAIAELHGGQALFSANSGIFSLKVMIHLK